MSWIKRNLYFLIGGVVAVLLLGLAGFYCFSKWSLNNAKLEDLEKAYADWERISGLPKSPGNDKVNNIELAREQQQGVRAEIQKVASYFQPVPPVPNPANGVVTAEAYASSLRRTVDQLQHAAASGSVTLPPSYDFSFSVQRTLTTFAAGSLNPLAGQLGDIKAICGILFAAKINSLDSIRRERVSADDQGVSASQSDYLDPSEVSVTNTLAVLVPYEVKIHCFSAELGGVLAGFANVPDGIIVKAMNVEPGNQTESTTPGATGFETTAEAMQNLRNRYLPGPGYRYGVPNPAVPPPPVTPRGGLATVLDEKQLQITLVLNVVKVQHGK